MENTFVRYWMTFIKNRPKKLPLPNLELVEEVVNYLTYDSNVVVLMFSGKS